MPDECERHGSLVCRGIVATGWVGGWCSLDGEQAREADDAEVISASQAAVRPWVGWRCSMASRPKTPKSSGFIDDPKLTRTRRSFSRTCRW